LALVNLLFVSGFKSTAQAAPTPATEQGKPRMIVVSSQEEAERILSQLRQGQDFATLAKQKSIDTTSDAGGLMQNVLPSTLRPEMRDALQAMAPGQLSPVLRTPLGYAILLLVERSHAQEN